jgi:hypothetical protein
MKYTEEYLRELAEGDLVLPQHRKVYNEMLKNTIQGMMGKEAVDAFMESDYALDLEPFEYVSDLSLMVNELAELVLEEREKYTSLLADIKRSLEDSIFDIENISKAYGYGSDTNE